MKKEGKVKESRRDIADGPPLWAWFIPWGLSLGSIIISIIAILGKLQ